MYTNKLHNLIKYAKNKFDKKVFDSAGSGTKNLWKYVNNKLEKN